MAFVAEIKPNSPEDSSHQTSPGYVLTFVRWSNRSTASYQSPLTKNIDGISGSLSTEDPMVVTSDAINVIVKQNKSNFMSQMTATLLAGEINYAAAIAPGDFVFVNMLNWGEDVERVKQKALSREAINKVEDGFKGFFRVKNIRKRILSNPETGAKSYNFTITAAGFDEFNSVIYYNPILAAENQKAGSLLFISSFASYWNSIIQKKNGNNVQSIIDMLFRSLLGHGMQFNDKAPNSTVSHFRIPPSAGKLLGRPQAQYVVDIYNRILGIWGRGSGVGKSQDQFKEGFNQGFSKDKINKYLAGKRLQGNRQVTAQDFNYAKYWAVFQNYLNPLLNEMYTTYRIDKQGFVMPTVVVRQKPFNTQNYSATVHTKFLDLPRWKIASELIYGADLGKSDEQRINFVQVFTRSIAVDNNFNQALQIAGNNYQSDYEDVARSGMRPYVATSNFDFNVEGKSLMGPKWSMLVYDWLKDGHLKENGVLECAGILDPIAVGDNLEFDNIVYHIEGITHTMSMSPSTGHKTFRTKIELSAGVHIKSTGAGPVFSEMNNVLSSQKRFVDADSGEGILPGYGGHSSEDKPSSKSFTLPKKIRDIQNKKGKK